MKQYFLETADKYRKELLENILPFWIKNGIDRVHGGVFSALDQYGELLDSDKSVWFQGRAAWIFAYTYNNIEKRPEFLEAAKSCVDFIENHCIDSDGHMFFQVTIDGTPVRKRRYAFSETFAAIAFAEYSIATGNKTYATKALETFNKVLYYFNTPGVLDAKFLEGFVAKGHSPVMILIDTAHCVLRAIDSPILRNQIKQSIEEIERDFVHPQFKALLETVSPDGSFIDSIAGRVINPGHSLETGWFILEEAYLRGWDAHLIELGTKIIDWSWEWGWDKKHGGIVYFRDCKNRPPQEYWHDMKFWWPQNEAVLAALYGFFATGDEKYAEMHKLADKFQFEHLKDPHNPEWFGYLHYDNTVAQTAKGNMYKGPFHIPRMLIKGEELCRKIAEKL